MKFLSISLKNIRNFEEKTIQFQDGLTIVCGPNESGKSTILDSILFSITGAPEDLPTLKRFRADMSSIQFRYQTDQGDIYTLTRTLYPKSTCVLTNISMVEDPQAVSITLSDHFGSTSKLVLENSSVVRHNEMEVLRKMDSKEVVRTQIQVALSGTAKTSTEEVIAILERNLESLKGFSQEMEDYIEELEKRLTPFSGIDEEYSRLATRLRVYEGDKNNYQKDSEVHTSSVVYRDLVREIEKTQKVLEQIEDIKSYIASIPLEKAAEIERLKGEASKTEKAAKTLSSVVEERERELEAESEKLLEKKEGFFQWINSLFGRKVRKVETEGRIQTLEELLKSYRKDLYEMERKSEIEKAAIAELTDQMGDYKGESLEYLYQLVEQYKRRIADLLEGKTEEDLRNRVMKDQKDADDLRSSIVRTQSELLEKDEEAIQQGKEELDRKIEGLHQEIEKLKGEFEEVTRRKEERDRIQKSLEASKLEKKEADTRIEIDQEVLDTLSSVCIDLKALFIPQLEERTGRVLKRITRKYDRIRIRREDLEVFINLPDQSLTAEFLSQGTKDQLYLSLRIALSELLSGGRNLPLLFDEPFYTSDRGRMAETFRVLQEIAQNTQVILFTHNEEFLKYGTPVILGSEEKEI